MSAPTGLKRKCIQKVDNVEEVKDFSILDLPELALEGILSRLSPASLCNMACVCRDLRERCRSNHLWEPRLKAKWGKVIGPAAYREWQWTVTMSNETGVLDGCKVNAWLRSLSCIWQFSWLRLRPEINKGGKSGPPSDSVMAWYLALESGQFWFPAQVYNRERGHVGFMLSCYDAELSYDSKTDTFKARYPPHGHRKIVVEEGVQWDRLRAPPVDTPAHDLHPSVCLNVLCPGDHVEIQWRRNKEFPYGWWYGVVGHSDYCDRDSRHCQCHLDDTVILEFNQYTPGSRWRRAAINRKDHHEEGNEDEGFYGGIRKLQTNEEILTWKQLWPSLPAEAHNPCASTELYKGSGTVIVILTESSHSMLSLTLAVKSDGKAQKLMYLGIKVLTDTALTFHFPISGTSWKLELLVPYFIGPEVFLLLWESLNLVVFQ